MELTTGFRPLELQPEPHDGKPVGTVFLGVHTPEATYAVQRHYEGDRVQIRASATADAILLLTQAVHGTKDAS